MIRVAVLASTNGTDMEVLLDKNPLFELALVICNKECGALEKAKQSNIPHEVVKENFEENAMKLLEDNKIDLVVLIGFMRIIPPKFVQKWRNKIMNIHPSLLPAFPGGMDLNVHDAVLERGCKVTGCTLHFIDEGADTGPIIMQKVVPVLEDDTSESLKIKVQKAEQDVILEAVKKYAEGKINVAGDKVRIGS